MGLQRRIWRVGEAGSQSWNRTQGFIRHQTRDEGFPLGPSNIVADSNVAQRQRPKRTGGNRETCWGTSMNLHTVCEEGLNEALHMLDLSKQRGFGSYSDACAYLLQGCVKRKALEDGKGIHAHIMKSGFLPNVFLETSLVSMYVKCGSVSDALQVFDKMPVRNVISWNAMITGLVQRGNHVQAMKLFQQMQAEGMEPNKITFLTIVNACASPIALEQSMRIHAGIIKAGLESDVRLGTALVSMYCNYGRVEDARQVFDRMPKRDVVSWTAMITGFAHHGYGVKALEFFRQMQREGMKPNKVTFISILNACANPAALEQGKRLHQELINDRFESDYRVGTALVSMYCRCGSVVDARLVFDLMPKKDVVSWNAIIAGSAQHGHGEEALVLFWHMRREGMKPNWITFISILSACTIPAALEQGKQVHADINQAGLESDVRVGTALVSMYCRCGSVEDALQVFEKIPKEDVVTWNAIITGLALHGHGEEALEFFQQMQREGVKPNNVTFISLLNVCATPAALEQGQEFHSGIIKAGFESDVRLGTALVSMYCKCGSVVDARQAFDRLIKHDAAPRTGVIAGSAQPGHGEDCSSGENARTMQPAQNVTFWNAMIAGYAQQGHSEEALELFRRMHKEGIKFDEVTCISLLATCASPEALEEGKCVHANIIDAGYESDVRVGNALVSMYCKCGSVVDARRVFDEMPNRDVVSWTVIIAGSAQQGHGVEALELFRQMQEVGVKPNRFTFLSILGACVSLASLEEGKWVHAHIINSGGYEADLLVANALIDMYAKCGSVGDARQVFDKISDRDVFSWTAMITGYAQHGHGKDALELFEQMEREGVKPNEVTFIGVLSACSHVGLVDEGHYYFLSMSRDHGITPSEKHCGCMVDLLGRAGCLDEAEDFIKEMSFEPGTSVWGALLGACRIHGNVDLAERAAHCIVKLEPQNDTVYEVLSNIYCVAGRWDDVENVRKVMEGRR